MCNKKEFGLNVYEIANYLNQTIKDRKELLKLFPDNLDIEAGSVFDSCFNTPFYGKICQMEKPCICTMSILNNVLLNSECDLALQVNVLKSPVNTGYNSCHWNFKFVVVRKTK